MPKCHVSVLKSASINFYNLRRELVLSQFKNFVLIVSLVGTVVLASNAQEEDKTSGNKLQDKPPAKEEKKDKNQAKPNQTKNEPPKAATAETIAELAVYIYSGYAGRPGLQQIRKTSIERGKLNITNADGTIDQANYEKRILRGDNLDKEKIRLDQEFPTARYALIYNDSKIIGLFNESVFTPREDASKAFQNQIWHGLEALLRYKENEATVALGSVEKFMGVEYYPLDVKDKQNRTTRFFISKNTSRVMWLEYTEDEIKYVRKFYDYRYAQGTLVPYRSILFANGKQIEETTISTVTYGQKVEEDAFQAS